jgi:glycerol-3-phosphate cytidylyltransferase-like family protein
MQKPEVIKYKCAVTFGRFCIVHFGHIELIQQMLNYAEYADVHLSGNEKNNDFDIRVLMLKHLCRLANVDPTRVRFYNSPTATEAMTFSVDMAPFNECVLVLGSDQMTMGYKLSEAYDTGFIINRRSTSSTEIRYFLDASDFIEDLKHLYRGDEFALTLAKVLRQEELHREGSNQVTNKAKERPQGEARIESSATCVASN